MLSEAKRQQVIARALASVGTLRRVLMFWAATDYTSYRHTTGSRIWSQCEGYVVRAPKVYDARSHSQQ